MGLFEVGQRVRVGQPFYPATGTVVATRSHGYAAYVQWDDGFDDEGSEPYTADEIEVIEQHDLGGHHAEDQEGET